MSDYKVVPVRATGLMPDVVAETVEEQLTTLAAERWELKMIQPIIFNSQTTGYLLLIFQRESE